MDSDRQSVERAPTSFHPGEAEFRALLEFAPDAMVIVDSSGRMILVNGQAERMFGWTRGEMIGRPIELLVPDTAQAMHVAQRNRFFENPHTRPMGEDRQLEGRRKDGSTFPVEVSLGPIRTATGLMVTAAVRDITSRRRAEQQVRKLSSALEQSADSVFVTDRDGAIEYVNPAFERLNGWSRDEVIGRTPRLFKSGRHKPEFYKLMWDTLLAGNVFRAVLINRRKDGTLFHEEKVIAPLKDRGGQVTHFVSNGRDVTDRIRAEEDVNRLNEELESRVRERTSQLEDANKELESFTYSVSHDLRAPLRHLIGFSELLRRSAGPTMDEKSLRHIDTISSSAKRMGKLVDDLLAFSRMGRSEMRTTVFRLEPMVQEVIRELEPETAGRSVTWSVSELAEVSGDPSLIRLVISNLLGNAVKYTRPRPTAHIAIEVASESEHEWVFVVRDNGVGFDMKYVGKLFGVFQRLHDASEFEGTGIGLATVRRILHRHGSRAWAESPPQGGAEFYFSLPKDGRR